VNISVSSIISICLVVIGFIQLEKQSQRGAHQAKQGEEAEAVYKSQQSGLV
jgi:hypothetical protein